jgi:hypothetical protein
MSRGGFVYLTQRQAAAAMAAILAMLAGEEGEGDWPPDVSGKDLDEAADKIAGITSRGSHE